MEVGFGQLYPREFILNLSQGSRFFVPLRYTKRAPLSSGCE